MKKTTLIGLALTLALALVTSTAMAGPWGGRSQGMHGMGPMFQNLTPEQSSQVLALQQAHHEKVAPIQQELFTTKMELRTLMFSQNSDQVKAAALQKKVFDLMDEIQQESSNLRMSMLNIITPRETN